MPRKKLRKQKRSVPHPVSLFPIHIRHGKRRAKAAKISFSRYLQALVEHDCKHDVIGEALTAGLRSEGQEVAS